MNARPLLFAMLLFGIVILGCGDGKLNLVLFVPEWFEKELDTWEADPMSSADVLSSPSTSSSSGGVPAQSSSSGSLSSSSLSSSSEQSSGSRGVRSSTSKTDDLGNTYEDYPMLEIGAAGVEKGWASRYWDGCKPHCSWLNNIGNPKPWTICKNCDKDNNETKTYIRHPDWDGEYYTGYLSTESSCDGGEAYVCFDMAPIAINDTLAYGFAAMNPDQAECGACYLLEFDGNWNDDDARPTQRALKGKKMIVKASNIGPDVEYGQFDIMIPGGGVGAHDAFSGQLGISADDLGAGTGGLLTNCEATILPNMGIRDGAWRASLEEWQECLRSECRRVFDGNAKYKQLLDGCLWQADWFMAANNPTLYYKKVPCPKYLDDKYASSIHTEPPPLPDYDSHPWVQCSIQGLIDCKQTGWYD